MREGEEGGDEERGTGLRERERGMETGLGFERRRGKWRGDREWEKWLELGIGDEG